MLISMPHGTSTIFGDFQAILALLARGSISALAIKLSRDGKFASEIFCNEACGLIAAQQRPAARSGRGRQSNAESTTSLPVPIPPLDVAEAATRE
jgi:hypothetical protein